MSIKTLECRAFWKTESPDWLRDRERKWREIRKSPVFLECPLRKDELNLVKGYFLYGPGYPRSMSLSALEIDSYDPDCWPLPISSSLFFSVWLHAEPTLENWSKMKEQFPIDSLTDESGFFRRVIKMHYPIAGSLFNGLDSKFYFFFDKTRCRREDFPDKSDEQYGRIATNSFYVWVRVINKFLGNLHNKDSMAPDVLLEWSDSIQPALNRCPNRASKDSMLKGLAEAVKHSALIIKKGNEPAQIEMAEKIVNHLNTVDFPPWAARIEKALAKIEL